MEHDEAVAELELLAELGPRFPGSASHDRLVDHVAAHWADLGLTVREDVLRFDRWDLPSTPGGLTLTVGGRPVEISSVFPYSGTTGAEGVRGPLGLLERSTAPDGVAVVELRNRPVPFDALVRSWGQGAPWGTVTHPVLAATLSAERGLAKAKRAGARAVVFAWRGISAANARGQQVPFTLPYQDIPAVLVAGEAADTVLARAERGDPAELVLDAALTPDSAMRTVWTVVEGAERPDETVLVITHSDGTNVVEENGHLALVELARDVVARRPERSVVFVFTAGHLRIPAVIDGHGQATTRWLDDHRDWWAGGDGQRRAVAGLVAEHLGAVEYADDPATGGYGPTGRAEPELLYATTRELKAVASVEWRGAESGPPLVCAPTPVIQFGEGQPLTLARIPNISLVTAPQYLLSDHPGDYVDVPLLLRQVDSFRRLLRRLDTLPADKVGTVPAHTRIRKIAATARLTAALAATALRERRTRRSG
ncbi:hypothetical protein SAMN05192558_104255 [Actinokineospora alba]|uniref:PA domain-containing protein n=1 Tax=Actinokineospora alba TaxID=504798 RepID=A0A1H0LRI7_9PSEU|nr:hypothetical protein [Actinokineospora alba]TDP67427.1 hypothetical protein C8E96_2972 [Actinokineospora alba]SDI97052.1 hypothetical protein SAMN05421871_10942 [Actinokineospora alba]SDO70842.1 hypothetical protein SAMN05192558_104255 [Actinokineospora alba]